MATIDLGYVTMCMDKDTLADLVKYEGCGFKLFLDGWHTHTSPACKQDYYHVDLHLVVNDDL